MHVCKQQANCLVLQLHHLLRETRRGVGMIASRRTGIRRGHGPINHFAPSRDIFWHQPDANVAGRIGCSTRSISSEVHDIQAATDQLARSQDDTSGELDAAFGRMHPEVGAPSSRCSCGCKGSLQGRPQGRPADH